MAATPRAADRATGAGEARNVGALHDAITQLVLCLILGAMPTMNRIFARQVGRLAFGGVLLAGVTWLVAVLGTGSFAHPGPYHSPLRLPAWEIIAATWLAALGAGQAARAIAVRFGGLRSPDARFAASLVVPTAGIALLLPVTLQLPVVALLADLDFFDIWAMGSLWITGLAHVVFAGLCAARARELAAGKRAVSPYAIYFATVLTACVPVVFLADARVVFVADMDLYVGSEALLVIPPILVAFTALPFLRLQRWMQRLAERERTEIAAAQQLPLALALPPRR
jgi:hypothetical protein